MAYNRDTESLNNYTYHSTESTVVLSYLIITLTTPQSYPIYLEDSCIPLQAILLTKSLAGHGTESYSNTSLHYLSSATKLYLYLLTDSPY